jgi:N-acetylneuraminate synthase
MIEVIAELGINHNGDIKTTKKLIDIAYASECHYVKFQKRDIDLVYSEDELSKYRESPWGTTTRQQKEGLEFDKKDYDIIDKYCKKKIPWFASPWDINSAAFLFDNYDVPFIKIPSALITNEELLYVCKQHIDNGYPQRFMLSSGMSDYNMIDQAIGILGQENIYCIMHCTSTYPTDPKEINAACITTLMKKYPWTKIGFSNHYPGLMGMVLAAAYGAEVIECHITLDRTMYGSDQAASIEPRGLFELMSRLKLLETMIGDGEKQIYDSELPIIKKLRR